jgi:hypothetical protein
MVCQGCGSPVAGSFCAQCGAAVVPAQAAGAAPPAGYPVPPAYAMPPGMLMGRVARHVHTLGVLWCVYGVYRAAAGLFAMLFLMGISTPAFMGGIGLNNSPFMPFAPVMSGLALIGGVYILLTSGLAFVTGYALLTRRPWGRTLGMVAAIMSLIKLPVGTALGTYTLWVLAPSNSRMEYDAIADPR